MGEIREALEFMKTGKHVGKVIVTNYAKEEEEEATTAPAPLPPKETEGGKGGEAEATTTNTVLRPLSVTVEQTPTVRSGPMRSSEQQAHHR